MTATLSPSRSSPGVHRAAPPPTVSRIRRLVRGPADQPAWTRPALLALLAATAVLYLWDLSASGDANSFYAAAVQAGTQSWKAWLFGSLDSGNAITVDKPPASLWVMVASARLFGFSSWSLLVPQALMGVAAVGLLFGAVRRWAGPAAGLVAGAAIALTPAAVLMFRFDNPDAMLTLLLVAAAYSVVRAIDATRATASTWWLVAAGTEIGFGFLTKMGQALLIVPALGLVYLVAGPTRLRTRIAALLAALVAMVVSAGWFIALVELWPAADRPYIGGSTNNSLLELALGYNGIGRLLGGSGNGGGSGGGGAGGGGGNSGFGGAAGITRLFTGEIALEVSWLLPAALILLGAVVWISLRAPRTDRLRAAMILWGGWTLVTGLVLSFMSGTMHPYYTIALAPGIAALVGIGVVELLRRRTSILARAALVLTVAATAAWSFVLLAGSSESFTWTRWVVLGAGVVAVLALLAGSARRLIVVGLLAAVLTGAGMGSYAVLTASTGHTGSIPSVGTSAGGLGGGGGARGERPTGGPGGSTSSTGSSAGTASGTAGSDTATAETGAPARGGDSGSTSTAVVALLKGTTGTWSAAVSSSQSAASLELASGTAVMATGGWSGSDSAVTLAQFQADVAAGNIHYWIDGGMGGGGGQGGSTDSTTSQITTWVKAHHAAETVGNSTVYDLTAATS